MRRTDGQLLKDLLAKLGVSRQRLYQRVGSLKKELPMDTPDAIYVLAFEEGLDLTSYISAEETAAVRGLVAELRAARGSSASAPAPARPTPKRPSAPKQALITISGVGDVERLPAMSAVTARDAKKMSETVYPMIYVFENSARELITAVLESGIGPDWWKEVVPRRVREGAEKRKANEADDPWHGRRGARMIDYTELSDLPKIVGANDAWPHFEPIFARKAFFEELVNDFNVSRRVTAHMNPVGADDIKHLEATFRKWAKTLKAKVALLPGS